MDCLPDGWTAYPEACGFDLLLVRADGVQIGVEAKLSLNAEVIHQISPWQAWTLQYSESDRKEPDYRAVLIPAGKTSPLSELCAFMGVKVIEVFTAEQVEAKQAYHAYSRGHLDGFKPALPGEKRKHGNLDDDDRWHDWCPARRCEVPEYISDAGAGHSAPVALTPWKIRAIRICIIMERRGYVTRADFKAMGIHPSRWVTPGYRWLDDSGVKGRYVAGRLLPGFRSQHPTNWLQIEADIEKWGRGIDLTPAPVLFDSVPANGETTLL